MRLKLPASPLSIFLSTVVILSYGICKANGLVLVSNSDLLPVVDSFALMVLLLDQMESSMSVASAPTKSGSCVLSVLNMLKNKLEILAGIR
jgi:hypothetical protein